VAKKKKENKLIREPKLFAIFLTSFFLLILSAILTVLVPQKMQWILLIIILAQLSSSIFFPIIFGYFYEGLKEKHEGETIWKVFREFSDGGILRVYKDREETEYEENALKDLRKAFEDHQIGKVKLVGVSLRVFFNQTGPFYRSITKICNLHKMNDNVTILALLSDPDSPEILNRAKIETPDRLDDPLIKIDIKSTIFSIQNLKKHYGTGSIEYGVYSTAPYCTAIIFPNKCYFSPNL